jgi:hypothetical protein
LATVNHNVLDRESAVPTPSLSLRVHFGGVGVPKAGLLLEGKSMINL